ncbi:hypothetical protein BJ944DRAFT_272946 [Cunninghamella echinulata]|nr:hypothetical protein BJ944DRAFT_272946 [Cunninghamella echinulata]
MRLSLFTIGAAAALCFLQQATANQIHHDNNGAVVKRGLGGTEAVGAHTIPGLTKRDGGLLSNGDSALGDGVLGGDGLGELLHEVLGLVGLTGDDLVNLNLDELVEEVEELLGLVLGGDSDGDNPNLTKLKNALERLLCSEGKELQDDDDLTKREDHNDSDGNGDRKCKKVGTGHDNTLISNVLNLLKGLLGGGEGGIAGGILSEENGLVGGLLKTVTKIVGCILGNVVGESGGIVGGTKRDIIRREAIKAAILARRALQ